MAGGSATETDSLKASTIGWLVGQLTVHEELCVYYRMTLSTIQVSEASCFLIVKNNEGNGSNLKPPILGFSALLTVPQQKI